MIPGTINRLNFCFGFFLFLVIILYIKLFEKVNIHGNFFHACGIFFRACLLIQNRRGNFSHACLLIQTDAGIFPVHAEFFPVHAGIFPARVYSFKQTREFFPGMRNFFNLPWNFFSITLYNLQLKF